MKHSKAKIEIFQTIYSDYSTPGKLTRVVGDDFFKETRYFFRFGRIIHLIPFKGTFSTSSDDLNMEKRSWQCWLSCGMQALMAFAAILSMMGAVKSERNNPVELAQTVVNFIYYSHAFFLYTHFVRNGDKLLISIKRWGNLNIYFDQKDVTLFRDVHLLFVIIMTSAILENVVGQLNSLDVIQEGYVDSFNVDGRVAKQYIENHKSWSLIIPYNPCIAIVAWITEKIALYSWNYADILIIVCSRGIYFKFRSIFLMASEKIKLGSQCIEEQVFWERICKDHLSVCQMLHEFDEFLSPIVFSVFSLNIYFFCMLLYEDLTPSAHNTVMSTIYSIWSFIHITGRMFLVALFSSRINDFSNEIGHLISNHCPSQCYTVQVKRTDLKINSGATVGLTGLKCFVLTKPFILSIMSCVFTIEIVFLQSYTINFNHQE